MRNANTPVEMAVTTIRVRRDLLDDFHRVAESNHRTFAQEIRRLMEQAVAEHKEAA